MVAPAPSSGFNGSTEHLLQGRLQWPQKLNWFASADSNRTLPRDYSLTNRFSGGSTVVSMDSRYARTGWAGVQYRTGDQSEVRVSATCEISLPVISARSRGQTLNNRFRCIQKSQNCLFQLGINFIRDRHDVQQHVVKIDVS